MPSIALQRHDVIVGVDTHKDEHIAVAIDGLGGLIDKPKLAAAGIVRANGLELKSKVS